MRKIYLALALLSGIIGFGQQAPEWEWVKNVGVTSSTQTPIGICVDANDNVFIAGVFGGETSFIDKTLHKGNFLAKYTAEGQLIWVKNFDMDIKKIKVNPFGNLIVSGNFYGVQNIQGSLISSHGDQDFYIATLDPNGNIIWLKSYGSTGADQLDDLEIDSNGSLYLTGFYTKTFSIDHAVFYKFDPALNTQYFTVKLDMNGVGLWVDFGPTNIHCAEGLIVSLIQDTAVCTAGVQYRYPCDTYCWSYFRSWTNIHGINPGYSFAGSIYTFPMEMKFDNRSNLHYIEFAGGQMSNTRLTKFSRNSGWSMSVGCPGYDTKYIHNRSLHIDADQNIYLAGTAGNFSVNPGDLIAIGTETAVSKGKVDILIVKLDSLGKYKWVKTIGGPGYEGTTRTWLDDPVFMDVNTSGDCYILSAYNFQEKPPLPGGDTLKSMQYSISPNGNWSQLFIARLKNENQVVTHTQEKNRLADVIINPNPSSGKFFINGLEDNTEIRIYDLYGKCLYCTKEQEIDLSARAKGIYFLEGKSKEGTVRKKLIVE